MSNLILVNMPFGLLNVPPIGLSVLKAKLISDGFSPTIYYPNLDFAELISVEAYNRIALIDPVCLLGDFLFSDSLTDEPDSEKLDSYLDAVLLPNLALSVSPRLSPNLSEDEWYALLFKVKHAIPDFLDRCAELIISQGPNIVGLASFINQHIPALSLAKRIKTLAPETRTLLGGPHCTTEVAKATLLRYPFIDAVAVGKAEDAITRIANHFLRGESLLVQTQGLYLRKEVEFNATANSERSLTNTCSADIQAPVYEDYFNQLSNVPHVRAHVENSTVLTLERSRAGHQKSIEAVALEIERNSAHVGNRSFLIYEESPSRVHLSNLPQITAKTSAAFIHEAFESLTEYELRQLRASNVIIVTPDIDTLSLPALRALSPDADTLKRVRLLKGCKEQGINPIYRLCYGILDQPLTDLSQLIDCIPSVTHLPPPDFVGPFRALTVSPYPLLESPRQHGLRPVRAYNFIYSDPEASPSPAILLQRNVADTPEFGDSIRRLLALVSGWHDEYLDNTLSFWDYNEILIVFDTRSAASYPFYILTNEYRAILLQGADITDLSDTPLDLKTSKYVLEKLEELRLVFTEGERYLSLALSLLVSGLDQKQRGKLLSSLTACGTGSRLSLNVPFTAGITLGDLPPDVDSFRLQSAIDDSGIERLELTLGNGLASQT